MCQHGSAHGSAAGLVAAQPLHACQCACWLLASGFVSRLASWCPLCVTVRVFCCHCCCPAPFADRLCVWLSLTAAPSRLSCQAPIGTSEGTSMCTLSEQIISSNTQHSHTWSDFAININTPAITFTTLSKNCEMQKAQELNSRANMIRLKKSCFMQAVQVEDYNCSAYLQSGLPCCHTLWLTLLTPSSQTLSRLSCCPVYQLV